MSAATESLTTELRRLQLEWGLTDAQLSRWLHVTSEQWSSWTEPFASLPLDQARMQALGVLRVWQSLRRWLPEPAQQVRWLTSPHPSLDGLPPASVIESDRDGAGWVAYYVDSVERLGQPLTQAKAPPADPADAQNEK